MTSAPKPHAKHCASRGAGNPALTAVRQDPKARGSPPIRHGGQGTAARQLSLYDMNTAFKARGKIPDRKPPRYARNQGTVVAHYTTWRPRYCGAETFTVRHEHHVQGTVRVSHWISPLRAAAQTDPERREGMKRARRGRSDNQGTVVSHYTTGKSDTHRPPPSENPTLHRTSRYTAWTGSKARRQVQRGRRGRLIMCVE